MAEMIETTPELCKTCKYGGLVFIKRGCSYYTYTGVRRGCSIGRCDKYESLDPSDKMNMSKRLFNKY